MKLIYLTSKSYPSDTADKIYVRELAKAFSILLKDSFLLVVANDDSTELREVNVLDLKLGKHFKSVFFLLWTPLWIIRNKDADNLVFFSNDPYLLTILVFWKKLGFAYKICSDWHQIFGDWRDKVVAGSSDVLITTSHRLRKKLEGLKINSDRIHVVHGGIDLENYPSIKKNVARQMVSFPENKIIIGYVGFFKTLGMEKGIRTMIDALKFFSPDYIMSFIGGTTDEINEYNLYAQTQGVANRCIFMGRQSFNEVVVYEQAMDVLVIPYPDEPHFSSWGFPMKVYEYMASGRPIVYSRLEIMDEVLSDVAWSFTPGDSNDLARVIEELVSLNKTPRKKMSTIGKVENFTWLSKALSIINLLKT